jgi:SAM-dependent methyltransferase
MLGINTQLQKIKKIIGRRLIDTQFSDLSISEVFTKVYEEKYWKDNGYSLKYSSGTGSCEELSNEYCLFVANFIREKKISSIVDLGCGDFQVSKNILSNCNTSYTGYDCAPKLIEYNQEHFGKDDKIRFFYVNIIKDKLISADLCLIRQVLQHLSNKQIISILKKTTTQYKYIIITEHYPLSSSFTPNLDHQPGPRTRLDNNSAVVLNEPPFSVTNLSEVLSVKDNKYLRGYIKTFVIKN